MEICSLAAVQLLSAVSLGISSVAETREILFRVLFTSLSVPIISCSHRYPPTMRLACSPEDVKTLFLFLPATEHSLRNTPKLAFPCQKRIFYCDRFVPA
jgi:hypothetical protein